MKVTETDEQLERMMRRTLILSLTVVFFSVLAGIALPPWKRYSRRRSIQKNLDCGDGQ